jgi:benzoyl-CoA reductase subunit BamC
MKKIAVDFDKCTGCGTCELICSLHHYGVNNPKKSRIRVVRVPERGQVFPIIAGPVVEKECKTKCPIIIKGEEYDQCLFCRASCPSRPLFHEPDTGNAITCDLCTKCITFCPTEALTLVE